ncbi:MAG: ImmA/IrrE family metallo-endopeptidase [Bacteroidaceae bacterium]
MKKINSDTAELMAEKFRNENLEVSLKEPINIKAAIRKLNLVVAYRPLSDGCCGLSVKTKINENMFVLVNSNMTRGRQHFTVAHELFHLFYDNEPAPHLCRDEWGSRDVSEINANAFASALLLPKAGLLNRLLPEELASKEISMASVIRIEQYYGVSRSALLYRLKGLKLISTAVFNTLKAVNVMDSVKQLGLDVSLYHNGNENLVMGDFGEKAKLLYDREKISEGHYNELINLISDGKN